MYKAYEAFVKYTTNPSLILMGGFTSKHSHLTAVHDATCGPVKGVGYDQEDGSVVEGFLGVPYAEPPIGALRFKKPIAHRRWEEPLECTKFGPRAPQNDELLGQFVNTVGKSEEHCLSLNVFTPKWESDEWPNGFPVMVFIHAIPMAGNAECDFAIRTSKQQATLCKEFARFLGWQGSDDDSEGLLDFIDNQPLYKLEMGINPRRGFRHSQAGSLYFVPNFDGDFFPKPLSQLRKEVPKMQLMTGTTKYEGLFFIALGALSRNPEGIKKFMSRIFKKCDYGENSEEALELAYNFYFKGVHPKDQEKNIQQIVKFIGDYSINYGTYLFANKMSELKHDVYFYQFEYHNPGGFGIFRWLLPFLGSTHCTEMRYVLGKGIISKFKPNESDKKMIEVMTTYFTNFAKYGSPNGQIDSDSGQWEKHDSFTPFRHFKIDLEDSEMAEDYQDRRAELWDKLRALNVTRAQL
ncbi:hypothetical protein L5515_000205 [Caenorhabditis briggsae]|uniref:Carboxylesterase type B domain-containing protein n=1 Tax=Caenorhabditis briggsae TaxID=6238 RepID=A0AAE9E0U1_CAEBR|nr:hypothetical protein L5515_000205 [Caenorhabditis briggsae]